jgi:excisionase family DNA binding protein
MITSVDTLLNPLDKRKTLSIAELAEVLDLDHETVRRDVIAGHIPGGFQTKPGGKWKLRRSIVEAWWQKQGKKSTP